MGRSTLAAIAVVLVMAFSALGVAVGNAEGARGGMDSFGYRYTDSKSPSPSVSFNWIETRPNGTVAPVSGDDSYGGPFAIGFNFTYYGNRYTAFNISTNGMISFGLSTSDLGHDPIPDTWNPDNFIAAYWDDLYVNSGEITYQTFGSAPNRQCVVQYSNVTDLGGWELMTFEIVLCEGRGDVWLQYLTMNGMTGSGASIGMENIDGTIGVEYGYSDAVITDNLAVVIAIAPFFFSPSQTQYEKPGNSVTFSVTITNGQWFDDSFAIDYTALLGWSTAIYDSGMIPLTDTDGDGLVDTDTVATNSTVTLIVDVAIPISPASQVEITTLIATSFADSNNSDACPLRTIVLSAWFAPPHSDAGFDTDGDGLYNQFLINASVNVYVDGWYTIYGYLYTASESYIGYDAYSIYLTAGTNELELSWYGWLIYNRGVNSPYHAHLYLYNWTMFLEEDIHTTGSSYQYDDFMLQPGLLAPPFSDCGVDTDGDGLFDYLQINVTLTINYAGRFIVAGDLEDSNWNYFDSQTNDSTMSAGSVTVRLRYDAWTLWENGIEGVFHAYLYLQGLVDGTYVGLGSQWYTTSSYDLALFERPPGVFQPPHSERTTDADGDSLYDYLVIEVQVNISEEGDYRVRGVMTDWWGDTIDIVENSTHLTVGTHIVELWYPGWPIRFNGDSDNYEVELLLFNGTTQLDDDQYTTSVYYYYWDFETAPGWFEPPHTDLGDDTNGDTLFDSLVVRVGVNVTMDGIYQIDARLRDWAWVYIEDQSNRTFLTAGWNMVELRFTGWLIRDNGRDGPYTVLLTLYDAEGREMDSDTMTTAAYTYTEFQTIPAQLGWPHDVSAVDDDGDSLYERILVNVTVDVTTPGDFFVRGILYDSWWDWTSANGVWANLDSGTNTVQLSFPAFMVYGHRFNGTYTIYIYLEDSNRYYLDSDTVSTAFYYYDDFDPAPPRIYSTWAAMAPVIDGAFGATEWSTATVIDLKTAYPLNDLEGRLLVMNDGTNLYICYDIFGDTTMDDWDYTSIAFDTGNDDLLSDGGEDSFYVRGWSANPSMHYTYDSGILGWSLECSPFDTGLPDHSGLRGAASFGTSTGHAFDHRVFEYSIPLALIDTTAGQIVGFLGASQWNDGAYDEYEGLGSSWPVAFTALPEIGQYGEIQLAQSTITPPPSTTASVAGTAGSAGWHVSAVTVTLTATGGIGGVDWTEYSLNGGSWTDYAGPVSITSQGTHTLQYRSIDHASQTEATKTLTVKIDTVAPVTAGVVSGANVWLNSTDATSGVGSTRYRIDNGTWQTYAGMLTVVGPGTHIVEFYSLDAAGNHETTKSVSVTGAPDGDGNDGGISTSSLLILIGGIVAAIVVALILLLMLIKRKKGQQPTMMIPPGTIGLPPGPPSQ